MSAILRQSIAELCAEDEEKKDGLEMDDGKGGKMIRNIPKETEWPDREVEETVIRQILKQYAEKNPKRNLGII